MAAHDLVTMTIDTDEMVYTDHKGLTHKVVNAETFQFELQADPNSGETYKPKATAAVALDTGYKLSLDADKSSFTVHTDATAALNAGSLWFKEDDGYLSEWKIRTVTINNIDEPTELSSMVLERVDNPMITMTLTAVTLSQ